MFSASLSQRHAEHRDRAAVGALQPFDHLERRRLAGAVRADNREHFASVRGETDFLNRSHAAERLRHPRYLQHMHRAFPPDAQFTAAFTSAAARPHYTCTPGSFRHGPETENRLRFENRAGRPAADPRIAGRAASRKFVPVQSGQAAMNHFQFKTVRTGRERLRQHGEPEPAQSGPTQCRRSRVSARHSPPSTPPSEFGGRLAEIEGERNAAPFEIELEPGADGGRLQHLIDPCVIQPAPDRPRSSGSGSLQAAAARRSPGDPG